jgi:hypothetical protein
MIYGLHPAVVGTARTGSCKGLSVFNASFKKLPLTHHFGQRSADLIDGLHLRFGWMLVPGLHSVE